MPKYAGGTYARAMCDRCGIEVKYSTLLLEWTGYKVCPDCWDPKTELEFPNKPPVVETSSPTFNAANMALTFFA